MFLDESGDHGLVVIDPQYPVFVLGGIIVDADYANGELTAAVRDFKMRLFGHDNLILHTADINRTKKGFERLKDKEFREAFLSELNALMRSLQYQVVACAIKKDDHLSRYGADALDPYMFSLDILVERFCYEVGSVEGGGRIVAEKRGESLDKQLLLAFESLRVRGTRYMPANRIRSRIDRLECVDKQANVAGLQLADLVVSPIGRFVLGKPTKEDFRIVQDKFRCDSKGNYAGMGLVVLPKNV